MRKIFKIAAIAMSLLIFSSALSACRGSSEDEPFNEGMVHLYVGNFNGGYGDNWLYKAKQRFEAEYKDYNFGNGKVGVQLHIDSNDKYSGDISTKMRNWGQHVILAEAINYQKLVSEGHLADISDAVTTPINQDFITGKTDTAAVSDSKSLAEIMNPSMERYLNVNNQNKYYGVPFYEGVVGIVYDLDLFEEYGFYYAAEGYGDNGGFVQDINGNWIGQNGAVLGNKTSMNFNQALEAGMKLGNGPDGKENTVDDGISQTYDDFFALCERIEARGCEALTWPGNNEIQRYLNFLAFNLWADYEGVEQMDINFSLNGEATTLIDMNSFNASTGAYQTYSEQITSANGYLMQQQAGKFEAIRFIERLVRNDNCYDESLCFADINQYSTETTFIQSALPENKSRAMLIDGSWWQNEARNVFANMAVDYGEQYSAANRRFGMMPLPKANMEKVGEPSTLAFNTSTVILVNKYSTENDSVALNVAKQFVKFLHTQESLYEFTSTTSSAKPYNYSLSKEQIAGLTDVAKRNYEIHCSTDFVFSYSQNNIVKNFPERFACSGYLVFQSGGNLNEILSLTFYNNKNMTAWQYFKSMVDDHGKDFWNTNFSSYFD